MPDVSPVPRHRCVCHLPLFETGRSGVDRRRQRGRRHTLTKYLMCAELRAKHSWAPERDPTPPPAPEELAAIGAPDAEAGDPARGGARPRRPNEGGEPLHGKNLEGFLEGVVFGLDKGTPVRRGWRLRNQDRSASLGAQD